MKYRHKRPAFLMTNKAEKDFSGTLQNSHSRHFDCSKIYIKIATLNLKNIFHSFFSSFLQTFISQSFSEPVNLSGPSLYCTYPSSMDRTSRCNKVDAIRLYASYWLNLLLLKGQRCDIFYVHIFLKPSPVYSFLLERIDLQRKQVGL